MSSSRSRRQPGRRNRRDDEIDETDEKSGRNSEAECQLPKLNVVGSIPIARSRKIRGLSDAAWPFFVVK
jgi:hypothetical protein